MAGLSRGSAACSRSFRRNVRLRSSRGRSPRSHTLKSAPCASPAISAPPPAVDAPDAHRANAMMGLGTSPRIGRRRRPQRAARRQARYRVRRAHSDAWSRTQQSGHQRHYDPVPMRFICHAQPGHQDGSRWRPSDLLTAARARRTSAADGGIRVRHRHYAKLNQHDQSAAPDGPGIAGDSRSKACLPPPARTVRWSGQNRCAPARCRRSRHFHPGLTTGCFRDNPKTIRRL